MDFNARYQNSPWTRATLHTGCVHVPDLTQELRGKTTGPEKRNPQSQRNSPPWPQQQKEGQDALYPLGIQPQIKPRSMFSWATGSEVTLPATTWFPKHCLDEAGTCTAPNSSFFAWKTRKKPTCTHLTGTRYAKLQVINVPASTHKDVVRETISVFLKPRGDVLWLVISKLWLLLLAYPPVPGTIRISVFPQETTTWFCTLFSPPGKQHSTSEGSFHLWTVSDHALLKKKNQSSSTCKQ